MKKLATSLLLTIVAFLLGYFVHSSFSTNSPTWKIALKTNPDGSILQGSKEELINTLRKGADLRLAWGWQHEDKTLEHLADPIWIAMINEQEVMVHLEPQVLSAIDWKANTANYADSTLHNYEWRVVITTDGTFDAVWYDRKTNEVHRRFPQHHLMTWFVRNSDNTDNPNPLFQTN